jgi:hypothetical protein
MSEAEATPITEPPAVAPEAEEDSNAKRKRDGEEEAEDAGA